MSYLIDNNPTDIIISDFSLNTDQVPKTINFDILRFRDYEQSGEFDSYNAFRALFPGNFYKFKLSEKKTEARSWWYVRYDYHLKENGKYEKRDNKFNSYEEYEDALEKYKNDEEMEREIYKEDNFNITSLLGDLDFKDNNSEYKYLFFNNGLPPDCVGRSGGGWLTVARFIHIGDKWILDEYSYNIKCYGYFGYCSMPSKIIKLDNNKLGLYVKVVRDIGPSGADFNPIDSYSFLLLKIGDRYKQIFKEETTDLKNSYETGGTEWKSDITIEKNKTNGLNNLRLEINGYYDPKFPEEDEYLMKFDLLKPYRHKFAKKQFAHDFRIVKHYRFNGNKYVKVREKFID